MTFLNFGDTIGIIAPSAGLQNKDLSQTIDFFHKLGLKTKIASNLNNEYRYMAGTDTERAESINQMFADTEIKALFCLRGGAGATRILPLLDYKLIKKNPKLIIGLSDSTALQNAVLSQTHTQCLTGFLPIYDIKNNTIDETLETSLKNALFENIHQIISGTSLISGTTKGEIIGGCLSVLCRLCGTPYFPDLTGKILLLEDTGEKTYKIDLMFNQLKQQKNFQKLNGIILGQFSNCTIADPEDGSIEDCIKDFTADLNIPTITNFAYGHIPSRYVLPLGIPVNLLVQANKCQLNW